jgi:hypothetical protein
MLGSTRLGRPGSPAGVTFGDEVVRRTEPTIELLDVDTGRLSRQFASALISFAAPSATLTLRPSAPRELGARELSRTETHRGENRQCR